MKNACSVCRSNCLRLHGPEEEDDEDATACRHCALGKSEKNEHVEADRSPSFLRKISESTMSTLKLPLSFVSDQKESLGDSVILEGPSREKWRVELRGSSQSLSRNFGEGWEKFVADHVLQVNDQLTFSLSAKSFFQVEVYDGSGCQKRSALDATNTPLITEIKDLQSDDVSPILRPEELSNPSNARQPSKHHLIECGASRPALMVRSVNVIEVAGNDMEVSENDAENGADAGVHDKEIAEDDAEVSGREMEMPLNRMEDADAASLEDTESGGGLMKLADAVNGKLLPELHIVRGKVLSKRRAVKDSEIVRALQAANALKLSNPSAVIVMKSNHVYKGFWLGFPKQFREQWMPRESRKITLVNKGGHSWSANWLFPQGGLSGGWRRFSIDHRLEDQDVCVFEIVEKTSNVLLVHIFRVVGCHGEDPGFYPSSLTPPKLPEDKKKKRKSSDVSNGLEADGTPVSDPDKKCIRSRLALRYQEDAPIQEPTSGPHSGKINRKRKSGLLGDAKACTAPAKTNGLSRSSHREMDAGKATSAGPNSPTERLELTTGLSTRQAEGVEQFNSPGRASAPPTTLRGLSSSNHQEKLMGIGRAHIIERLVDQASLGEKVCTGTGGQGTLGSTPANAIDLGEEDRVPSRSSYATETPSASQQVLVVFRPDFANVSGGNILSLTNGPESYVCPSGRADFFPASSIDEPDGQITNFAKNSRPIAQRAPIVSPSRRTRLSMTQAFKVTHIYRGRHVGNENATEYLTELEGYSGKGVVPLARDDDTGFWWVPTDLFAHDMLHCFLE